MPKVKSLSEPMIPTMTHKEKEKQNILNKSRAGKASAKKRADIKEALLPKSKKRKKKIKDPLDTRTKGEIIADSNRNRNKTNLTLKQERFIKLVPVSSNPTEAALRAGYSRKSAGVIAHENLGNPKIMKGVELSLKEHMERNGLDGDTLSKKFAEMITYNSEKIVVPVGCEGNSVMIEKMRDAKVASSTLANIVKFKGSSLEHKNNNLNLDINNSTAKLAIKNLIQKLSIDDLKDVRQEIDSILSNQATIIES